MFPSRDSNFFAGGNNIYFELVDDTYGADPGNSVINWGASTFVVKPKEWATCTATSTSKNSGSVTMFKFTLKPVATSTEAN